MPRIFEVWIAVLVVDLLHTRVVTALSYTFARPGRPLPGGAYTSIQRIGRTGSTTGLLFCLHSYEVELLVGYHIPLSTKVAGDLNCVRVGRLR